MSLGNQTVGFVSISSVGEPGYLGVKQKSRVLSLVHGGQFQPASVSEDPDAETNTATEIWLYTGPPSAVTLAAKSTGELVYDGTDSPEDLEGNRFRIEGPVQPEHDFSGQVDHVLITCKRQAG